MPNLKEIVENDPLGEFFVWWMDLSPYRFSKLRKCLNTASREEDLQRFLTRNPKLLAVQLAGGQGRWVIPKKKLGCDYVTDFVVGEKSSVGFEWYAVELESPKARMFTKKGNPTHKLTHAITQIQKWRRWLVQNQNYASRPRDEDGLGLTDITPDLPGLILIGRRDETHEYSKGLRKQMADSQRIKIHSYDWLLGSGQLTNLPVRRIAD